MTKHWMRKHILPVALLLVVLAALCAVTVGSTLACLSAKTGTLTNTFYPAATETADPGGSLTDETQ